MGTDTATETAETKRPAAAEILDQLAGLRATLLGIYRLAGLRHRPQDLRIYKPQKTGGGAALSLDLRLEPEFEKNYVRKVSGGLFMILAEQRAERDAQGNALFDWDNAITAKLGVVDVTSMLVAIEAVRSRGRKVPTGLRPKDEKPGTEGTTVSMFHVFEGENDTKSTTGITWQFREGNSTIRVSKSKELFRSINLTLPEELRFRRGLERALDALEELGVR